MASSRHSPGRLRYGSRAAFVRFVAKRLYDIQQALDLVSGALEDCCATLSDEQKRQFEMIGPKRRA